MGNCSSSTAANNEAESKGRSKARRGKSGASSNRRLKKKKKGSEAEGDSDPSLNEFECGTSSQGHSVHERAPSTSDGENVSATSADFPNPLCTDKRDETESPTSGRNSAAHRPSDVGAAGADHSLKGSASGGSFPSQTSLPSGTSSVPSGASEASLFSVPKRPSLSFSAPADEASPMMAMQMSTPIDCASTNEDFNSFFPTGKDRSPSTMSRDDHDHAHRRSSTYSHSARSALSSDSDKFDPNATMTSCTSVSSIVSDPGLGTSVSPVNSVAAGQIVLPFEAQKSFSLPPQSFSRGGGRQPRQTTATTSSPSAMLKQSGSTSSTGLQRSPANPMISLVSSSQSNDGSSVSSAASSPGRADEPLLVVSNGAALLQELHII